MKGSDPSASATQTPELTASTKGCPVKGSDRRLSPLPATWSSRLNEGLPGEGQRLGSHVAASVRYKGASTKGCPVKGSDSLLTGRTQPGHAGLNEGLPGEGQRLRSMGLLPRQYVPQRRAAR